jgi:hypothetical protein
MVNVHMKKYGRLPTSVWTHDGCGCGGLAQFGFGPWAWEESVSSASSSSIGTPKSESPDDCMLLYMPKPVRAINFMCLDVTDEDDTHGSALTTVTS